MQHRLHPSDKNPAMATRHNAAKIDNDESGQRESNPFLAFRHVSRFQRNLA